MFEKGRKTREFPHCRVLPLCHFVGKFTTMGKYSLSFLSPALFIKCQLAWKHY